MTARAWFAACLLAAFFGMLGGWFARTVSADHRYIRALAERHERIAEYYLVQTERTIETDNTRSRNNGK